MKFYIVAKYLFLILIPSSYTKLNICMYVFPASHFKVHAAFEPGHAGEQSVFPGFFALGGIHFALGDVLFSPVVFPCR
jgi:hypothetical protein